MSAAEKSDAGAWAESSTQETILAPPFYTIRETADRCLEGGKGARNASSCA